MYIDPHVHCRDGKQSHKETVKHALEVCERAGVDAIFDMPNIDPPIANRDTVLDRLKLADLSNSKVFYGLYIGLTSDEGQIREAVSLWKELFPRVVGLKMYAGKSVGDLAVIKYEDLDKVYKILSEVGFDGVLALHCEKESFVDNSLFNPEKPWTHNESRPFIAELSSVQDQIGLCIKNKFKGNLHICHVTVPESVDYIRYMKNKFKELRISCGVTPHHLFLNIDMMRSDNGLLMKVNPPVRDSLRQKTMLEYLKCGYIDFIETDHAPHTKEEKMGPPYMSGIPWLNKWPLFVDILRSKGIDDNLISDLTFNNVLKIYNININKTENSGKYYPEYGSEVELNMGINKIKIGEKEVMPFTIPSGIITTHIESLKKVMSEISEVGIITTKSIGPEPRLGNREPVIGGYSPGCLVNAIGLKNPGADEFAKSLEGLEVPEDKFLLASIFGKNSEEFIFVMKKLEDLVDGFELNLSCPHAKGYGMQLGQDPEIVKEIVSSVCSNTNKPVFAKLTPNVGNIGEIAKAAVNGGACGIVAINTVGPGCYSVDGHPVLTAVNGGLSGVGIKPIGLKCIREIREAVGDDIIIIGMGGISDSVDIKEYFHAGANIIGIGTALTGMDDRDLKNYFSSIVNDLDLDNGEDNASKYLQNIDMKYKKVEIDEIINGDCDYKIFKTKNKLKSLPGQFVFSWIPRVGEKPFSVMDDDPLVIGVLERGIFTKEFNKLKKGDSFYVRGPYGKGVDVPVGSDVLLVGGGCGISGIYLHAKYFSKTSNVTVFLGAKDKDHLVYLDEFKKLGRVFVITDDGSLGDKGLITELFKKVEVNKNSYIFNCGPEKMIEAVMPFEKKISDDSRIFTSIEYMTGCGIGLCGSCSDSKGRRTCIDGPFLNEK
ncbi:hypothetical protein GOV12_05485 [Candidatus Pacearchaeota archaeon]|nr:hypothetical protein [Candidatus Pacearchaeota archaeon]